MLRALSGLCLVFWAVLAFAQPPVPALTGRVVDRAELLDAAQEAELNRLLAGHEQATGDQLVVVNVDIPTRLTADQRQLFEQLAKSLGSEVRPQERSFLDWLKETLGG